VAVSLDPKPRDFRDPAGYRQGRTLEGIADTLRIGVRAGDRISVMPAYSHLSEEERLAIATWIVSLQVAGSPTESPENPSGLRVEGGWVRALPASAPNSAAYLRLTNESSEPISIVGASSDAARSVEIHETSTRDGVSAMRRLERIVVAPGGTVDLKPGAAHIMLIGLSEPLAEGSEVSLTLELSNGATLELNLPVRRE